MFALYLLGILAFNVFEKDILYLNLLELGNGSQRRIPKKLKKEIMKRSSFFLRFKKKKNLSCL